MFPLDGTHSTAIGLVFLSSGSENHHGYVVSLF